MNEKIREFERASGIEIYGLGAKRVKWEAALEKYAELVVRECLNKIENEAAQYAEPVWAFELVNDIKEHFGIEK